MTYRNAPHLSAMPIIAILLICLFASCRHRKLEDPMNFHYVRIYIDENIKNVTYGFYSENRKRPDFQRPKVMRIVLSDPNTGEIIAERYLQSHGQDERGYYIDGHIAVEEGDYNMMAYNFDTEATHVRNEQDYHTMQAYTQPISQSYYQYIPTSILEHDNNSIRHEPDHLFITTCHPIKINRSTDVDTLRTHDDDYFTAHTVVKSYYLQVRIRGMEWVASAVTLLSGMAGSATLHNSDKNADDPANIFFGMEYTDLKRVRNGEGNTAVLYTTFNTFGKLPNEQNVLHLNFEFVKTDGSSQVETIDITSMFDTPMVVNEQWILLDHEIVITSPQQGGGGMTPGVDQWTDVKTEIQL